MNEANEVAAERRSSSAFPFLFFVGALIFSAIVFLPLGGHFVPSEAYVRAVNIVAIVIGGITGSLGTFWFFFYGRKFQDEKYQVGWRRVIGDVLITVLAVALGYLPVTIGYPIIKALAVRQNTSVLLTVTGTSPAGFKCSNRVDLRGMIFGLCRVPDEILSKLQPGMQIRVSGWGSEDGIFYDRTTVEPKEMLSR